MVRSLRLWWAFAAIIAAVGCGFGGPPFEEAIGYPPEAGGAALMQAPSGDPDGGTTATGLAPQPPDGDAPDGADAAAIQAPDVSAETGPMQAMAKVDEGGSTDAHAIVDDAEVDASSDALDEPNVAADAGFSTPYPRVPCTAASQCGLVAGCVGSGCCSPTGCACNLYFSGVCI